MKKGYKNRMLAVGCFLFALPAASQTNLTVDDIDSAAMLRGVICAAGGPSCSHIPEDLTEEHLRGLFKFESPEEVLEFLYKVPFDNRLEVKLLSGEETAWLFDKEIYNLFPKQRQVDQLKEETASQVDANNYDFTEVDNLLFLICAAGGPTCDDLRYAFSSPSEARDILGLATEQEALDLLIDVDRDAIRKTIEDLSFTPEAIRWLVGEGFDLEVPMEFTPTELALIRVRVFFVQCWGPYIQPGEAIPEVFPIPEVVVGVSNDSAGRPVLIWRGIPLPPECAKEAIPVGDYPADLTLTNDDEIMHFDVQFDGKFRTIALARAESGKFSSFVIYNDGFQVVKTSNKNWFGDVPDPVSDEGEIGTRKLINQ